MIRKIMLASLGMMLFSIGSAAEARAKPGAAQKGVASFYHDKFHGRKTASGQTYNKHVLSAAHRTLPLGSKVRVTDTSSGKSIVVKVNDRGPFVKGRIIDLSRSAAQELGMIKKGLTRVEVEVLSVPKSQSRSSRG